jgi:hypothetical protein
METLDMALGSEPHMDEEKAEQYALGDIAEDEIAQCDEHLLVCEACRQRVQQADEWLLAVQTAASRLRREPQRERAWLPRFLPAFAALAAVVLIVIWFRGTRVDDAPSAIAVALAANRGPGGEAHAPASKPLALQPDLTGLDVPAPYGIEIVDGAGARVWRGVFPGPPSTPLRPGVYFVRVYSQEGRLCREYALRVEPRG